jgi:hypothetical protein
MAEYIERDESVRKALEACIKVVCHGISQCDAVDIADAMDSIQAADVVEVRHGYWHLLDNCANEGVYCSNCRKKVYKTNYANQKIKSNYCPNCGAKMDGKGEGE